MNSQLSYECLFSSKDVYGHSIWFLFSPHSTLSFFAVELVPGNMILTLVCAHAEASNKAAHKALSLVRINFLLNELFVEFSCFGIF